MLDHVSIGVKELERSRRFYDAALKPLGLVRTLDFGRGSDWGAAAGQSGGGEFTITLEGTLAEPKAQRAGESASRVRKPRIVPSLGLHLCFRARDRAAVREFYRAALAHGGRDDGAPGLRPVYHADYFGAFALDPDGYRIEAVCHAPAAPARE